LLLAAACAALAYVLIPSLSDPALKTVAAGVESGIWYLMWLFIALGLVNLGSSFAKARSLPLRTKRESRVPPTADPSPRFPDGKAAAPLRSKPGDQPKGWSLGLLRDIEWRRFEALAQAYYQEKGFRAETTRLGADGGIDIKLYRDQDTEPSLLVQCKAWSTQRVGVRPVREFLGVLTHEKISKGFYITCGEFTPEARALALNHGIILIDGEMFLTMLDGLPDEPKMRLLALATEGEYTTPSCPSCGIPMIRRTSRKGVFWGCGNYPRCRQILRARRATHPP
jgi:restriction system protein